MRHDSLEDAHEGDGNTPLDEDELEGLMPSHLATRADLNQWEARNLELAAAWYSTRSIDVLDFEALTDLHRRMFGATWAWAGTFRRSDKSVSPHHWSEVPRLIRDLLENTRAQRETTSGEAELDRLAARFHHELVRIHPWPNGNGRHSRVATDLLLKRWKRPPFSWGARGGSSRDPEIRRHYIDSLRRADAGDFTRLYEFVRS